MPAKLLPQSTSKHFPLASCENSQVTPSLPSDFIFYLGTHVVNWLEFIEYPLFISYRRIANRKKLRPANCNWALDSGGFSEISLFNGWITSPISYVNGVRRLMEHVGKLDFASVQDYMCEPIMLQKTGLTVLEHQTRTIDSYLLLMELAPEVPWMPVLQGWDITDYIDHLSLYEERGINLTLLPWVGLGSVCRRQSTVEVEELIKVLHSQNLKLHGFGFKKTGLPQVKKYLQSADSMAWSFDARMLQEPLPGCVGHINCANCIEYATLWRRELLDRLNWKR